MKLVMIFSLLFTLTVVAHAQDIDATATNLDTIQIDTGGDSSDAGTSQEQQQQDATDKSGFSMEVSPDDD